MSLAKNPTSRRLRGFVGNGLIRTGIALTIALLAACGGGPGATLVTPPVASAGASGLATPSPAGGSVGPAATATATALSSSPANAASLTIKSPAEGSTQKTGSVKVAVDVQGWRLVDKIGQPNVPGEGHLIYYLGVDFVPTAAGRPARTEPGTYAAVDDRSYTWRDVQPGTHALWVQIVNNDDTPLEPPVTAHVTVKVE